MRRDYVIESTRLARRLLRILQRQRRRSTNERSVRRAIVAAESSLSLPSVAGVVLYNMYVIASAKIINVER